jgi:hypothetical protein
MCQVMLVEWLSACISGNHLGQRRHSMRTLIALTIAGMLVLGLLGLAFKLILGRYVLAIVLAFFGIQFVVTFLAFVFVILTSPGHTRATDFDLAHKNMESGRGRMSQWIN